MIMTLIPFIAHLDESTWWAYGMDGCFVRIPTTSNSAFIQHSRSWISWDKRRHRLYTLLPFPGIYCIQLGCHFCIVAGLLYLCEIKSILSHICMLCNWGVIKAENSNWLFLIPDIGDLCLLWLLVRDICRIVEVYSVHALKSMTISQDCTPPRGRIAKPKGTGFKGFKKTILSLQLLWPRYLQSIDIIEFIIPILYTILSSKTEAEKQQEETAFVALCYYHYHQPFTVKKEDPWPECCRTRPKPPGM